MATLALDWARSRVHWSAAEDPIEADIALAKLTLEQGNCTAGSNVPASQQSMSEGLGVDMTTRRVGKHRIYMNVGYDLTEEDLRQYFSTFGQVSDVYLPKHKSSRNKGFGFTTFETEKALEAALQTQEHVVQGHLVKINKAGPRPEHEVEQRLAERGHSLDAAVQPPALHGKGPRLYVGGIAEDLGEEKIRQHFSKWGNVVDVYFPGKGRPKRVNYCFVTFDNWRAAQRACLQSERSIAGSALQSINIAEERVTDQEQQQVALAAGAAVAAGGGPMLAAHNPNLTAALHLGGATIYGGGFNASPALQQLVLQQQQLESLGRAQSPHVGAQGHGQGMLASAALASGGFPQSPSGAGAYSAAQQQQQQLAQVISLQQLAAAAAAAQQMGNPLAHPGGHQQMGLWPQGAPAADMASLASSLLTGSSAGPASQPYAGGLPHGQLAPEYVHHSFPQSGYPPQSAPAPAGALPFQGGSASLPLPPSATSVDSQNMQSWGGLLPQTGSLLHASSLQGDQHQQNPQANGLNSHHSPVAAPHTLGPHPGSNSQPFPSPSWI